MGSIKKIASFAVVSIALASTVFASIGNSGTIVLSSHDGTVVVEGDFVSVDDGFYTVSTSLGELIFDSEHFDCAGEECGSFAAVE